MVWRKILNHNTAWDRLPVTEANFSFTGDQMSSVQPAAWHIIWSMTLAFTTNFKTTKKNIQKRQNVELLQCCANIYSVNVFYSVRVCFGKWSLQKCYWVLYFTSHSRIYGNTAWNFPSKLSVINHLQVFLNFPVGYTSGKSTLATAHQKETRRRSWLLHNP